MKSAKLNHLALVWLLVIAFYGLSVQGLVQLKFNTPELAISEGGNLPNELSILKIGENEMDITFHVRVVPGTAVNGTDYRSNSVEPYVFTSSITQLPIRTQLIGDRSGEPIEMFTICLPDSQVLQPMGAEAVEPTCVTITIVDDDSVVIGFKNMFEAVIEGGTISVCAEVKPEGLMLDPFDRIPLSIRTNPASSEDQFNTNPLVFEMSMNERCGSVSVADNNNMDGSRSYQLILEKNSGNTVPVELYPSNIPIIVIDNDGPDASFSFRGPKLVFEVQEGNRIDNIQVQKSGNTVLSYNVSLMVMPLTDSASPEDIVITKSLLFNPSTTLMDVGPIEIRDDSMSERRKEFNISIIDRIEPVNYNIPGIRTTVQGDPVKIIAYDDDYEVGFAIDNSNIMLTEGASTNICVKILALQPSDIDPTTNIQLLISTSNISAECLELEVNQVVLNSVNISRCFMVTVPNDNRRCDGTKRFTLQLTLTGSSNMDNIIILQGGNITVTLQDPNASDNRVAIAVGIVVPLVFLSTLVIAALLIVKLRTMNKNKEIVESVTGSSPPPPDSQLQSSNIPCSSNLSYGANERETEMTRTYESIQDQPVSLVENMQRGESPNGISAPDNVPESNDDQGESPNAPDTVQENDVDQGPTVDKSEQAKEIVHTKEVYEPMDGLPQGKTAGD